MAISRVSIKKSPYMHTKNALFQQNPLLIGEVLEHVFRYVRGEDGPSALSSYRLVCKEWDEEIAKVFRKGTAINLTRIMSPYPQGLGWRPLSLGRRLNYNHYYNCPNPEIHPYQNIIVTSDLSEKGTRVKVVRWFKRMGGNVKQLYLSASSTCVSEYMFIERVLTEFCPNLEILDVFDVICDITFLMHSSFVNKSTFICKGLRELRLSFDSYKCFSLTASNLLTSSLREMGIDHCATFYLKSASYKLNRFIIEHSKNPGQELEFPQLLNHAGENVILPIKLQRQDKLPNFSTHFMQINGPTDGGIVGKIMKEVNIERLKIVGLDVLYRRQHIIALPHTRPNNWRHTVHHLDMGVFFDNPVNDLLVLTTHNWPLKSIKLSSFELSLATMEMEKVLSRFRNTLEQLEIVGPSYTLCASIFLPELPKLKTYMFNNINEVRPSIQPRLRLGLGYGEDLAGINVIPSCGYISPLVIPSQSNPILSAALTTLELSVSICGTHACSTLLFFPNLLKIKMILEWSLVGDRSEFFKMLETSKVRHFEIGFVGYFTPAQISENNIDQTLICEPGNFDGLTILKMHNITKLPLTLFNLTSLLLSTKLTSLRIHKFRGLPSDEHNLRQNLLHIPSIELVNTLPMAT